MEKNTETTEKSMFDVSDSKYSEHFVEKDIRGGIDESSFTNYEIDKFLTKAEDSINDKVSDISEKLNLTGTESSMLKDNIEKDFVDYIKSDEHTKNTTALDKDPEFFENKVNDIVEKTSEKLGLDKFSEETKSFGNDLENAANSLKEVKEDMNKMSSEITDEMRAEQAKLESSLRKDSSDTILNVDTSIDKANEIKEEYIKDSYKDFAKENISDNEKTQDAYANYMMNENQANLESKNSLAVIDNEISKSTINSKEDFENHLDIKESALNSVKDNNPEKADEINKQLDDIKEIKESLNDKEQDVSVDKEADKSVEPAKDIEKDSSQEQESGFLDSAKESLNGMDLMAESRESDSAFDRGFAEAMDNWDKSIADERREEFDSSIER